MVYGIIGILLYNNIIKYTRRRPNSIIIFVLRYNNNMRLDVISPSRNESQLSSISLTAYRLTY